MEFAAPALLALLPLAAVPIVVHLLYKRRRTTIDFPSLWLLRNVELRLYEVRHERGGARHHLVGRDGGTCNAAGRCVWNAPVRPTTYYSDGSVYQEFYYQVRCDGGWAYHSGSSGRVGAGRTGAYGVTISMRRR